MKKTFPYEGGADSIHSLHRLKLVQITLKPIITKVVRKIFNFLNLFVSKSRMGCEAGKQKVTSGGAGRSTEYFALELLRVQLLNTR